MGQFHNIGPVTTIIAGATHYWEYWFGNGADVGAAVATPTSCSRRLIRSSWRSSRAS